MDIYELIEKLNIPKEVASNIITILNTENFEKYKSLISELTTLEASNETFNKLKKIFDDKNDYILTIYLLTSLKTFDNYLKKGIAKDIFIATMKCFSRFLNESKSKYDKYIFDRGWWTYRQTNMTLFRIGELEYEFLKEKDQKIVSIHIPSDSKFTNENVEISIKECKQFIEKYYPDYQNANFICDSWLLSPVLKELLLDNSNIINFQKRFNIINFNQEEKDYIIWIFNKNINTPINELSENTSLQRKVKELLKKNINIGSAYGILK